jgi:pimeloyl-ACP methyl ester carboxylesterase
MADRGLETRELRVVCESLELVGGLCAPRGARGIVVLAHGLPSASPPASDDDGYPGFAARFAESGWAALWFDMRAVRRSPGWFTIEGWVRDVRAAVEHARSLDGLGGLPLALVGSSAGGAVSVEAVRRGAAVDALVLLGAPAEWVSLATDAADALRRIRVDSGMAVAPEAVEDPRAWAAEFDGVVAERSIGEVRVPTLVVHGDDDEVVPVAHASRLAGRGRHVEMRIIGSAPHGLRRHPGVVDLVVEWLERVVSVRPDAGVPR